MSRRLLISLTAILLFGGVVAVHAGSLSPMAMPTATIYTLADIYTRLSSNVTATEGSHSFAPVGSPGPTLYTLKQIYQAIPTINSAKVLSGTTYLGVAGTAYGDTNSGHVLVTATVPGTVFKNLYMGTDALNAFPGGSQSNGGVDDFNNGNSAQTDRYTLAWTQCNASNSYCGTGDSGADAKDSSTGLIWSLPCAGSGCVSFVDATTPPLYSWNNSNRNNASLTAYQLCSGHAGWSLPTEKQLLQAFVNGSYGDLESVGIKREYLSSTTQSNNTANNWDVNLSYGFTSVFAKSSSANYVRCVR